MTSRVRIRAVLFILAAAGGSACDAADPAGPSAVSAPSLFVAQVGGQWSGTSVLSVFNFPHDKLTGFVGSDAECVGADVTERIRTGLLPTEQVAVSITQDAANVAGRLTSTTSGLSCSYKGSATLTWLAMDAASCDAPEIFVKCSNPLLGARVLRLQGSAIKGDIVGSSAGSHIDGRLTNFYNMFGDTPTQKDVPIASLELTYDLKINRSY